MLIVLNAGSRPTHEIHTRESLSRTTRLEAAEYHDGHQLIAACSLPSMPQCNRAFHAACPLTDTDARLEKRTVGSIDDSVGV